MQYSVLFLTALAATTTLAAPSKHSSPDNQLEVKLSSDSISEVKTTFHELSATPKHPYSSGPFNSVALCAGQGVSNQAARCKILNEAGNPIVVQRGADTDITFADGAKGKWTFRDGPTQVSKIICDPTFQKITPAEAITAARIHVKLSDSAEFGIQRFFPLGQRQEMVVNSGPFTTVEVIVGDFVEKQDYRCQVLDEDDKAIHAVRGANRDTTFSDAGKGEWTFEKESVVGKVICDPAFKAAPAASA
ncbi:MAG: hypothetical protein Q9210_004984 [Variospora velana]